MGFRIHRQKITAGAGNDFIGDAPGTVPISGSDIEKDFPTAALAGGLFDFDQDDPLEIAQVQLKLGGQASWSISILNADATEVVVFSGTTETSFFSGPDKAFYLHAGQKLKVVTVGGGGGFTATVFARN